MGLLLMSVAAVNFAFTLLLHAAALYAQRKSPSR
jgi:hypothetical protein